MTIPACNCPYSGYLLDAATAAYGDARPAAGDLSLCLECTQTLVFNGDLTVRKATAAEEREANADPHFQAAQRAIKSFHRSKVN